MNKLIELHAKLSDKAESGNPKDAENARDLLVIVDALLDPDMPASEPEEVAETKPETFTATNPEA
jgi:hypothetical protein